MEPLVDITDSISAIDSRGDGSVRLQPRQILGSCPSHRAPTIFKSVPERIAGTLVTLAGAHSSRPLGRGIQVKLTHEQLAALAGTSRQATTKILNEYADLGLVSLGRGRINILDHDRMRRVGGL